MTQRRRPREREGQRRQERHADGDGERLEERARHTGDRDERQEDDDRGDRRADERHANLFDRAADRIRAALARVAMQHDILDDDDRIVDHEAHSGSEAAERHEVEALADHPQHDEGDGQRGGDDQSRDERRAPVAEEQHHDERREQQADEYRVADARNRVVDETRLIVERLQVHAFWQLAADVLDFLVHGLGDRHGVAVGLTEHVQEHRLLCVGGYCDVDRLDGLGDFRDVADANRRACRCRLHDDIPDVLDRLRLAAHQAQDELMVVLEQPG